MNASLALNQVLVGLIGDHGRCHLVVNGCNMFQYSYHIPPSTLLFLDLEDMDAAGGFCIGDPPLKGVPENCLRFLFALSL